MPIRKTFNIWIKRIAIIASVAFIAAAYYSFSKTLLFFMVGWLFFIPTVGFVYMVYGLQQYKTVTRNVSLDEGHIEKLEPCMKKHKGNFSAAIRDIIDQNTVSSSFRNFASIDNFLLKWMVNEVGNVLIPDNVLDEIIDPRLISSVENLESFLNKRFRELEWDVDIVLKYDNNTSPSDILIEITGESQKIKFVASLISQFLVKNSLKIPHNMPLKILSSVNSDRHIRVELSRSNKKEAFDSLVSFFGSEGEIIKTIRSNPAFWKSVINAHILSDYNMVTVHRNYFEDLFADKVPMGEIIIENMAKKPIREIPLEEVFSLIKQVYETSRIIDRVEIDKENLVLFHNYRNKVAVEKMKKSLVMLLEASGHLYDAKSTDSMIFLTHKQSKSDVDVLKNNSNSFESGTNTDFC